MTRSDGVCLLMISKVGSFILGFFFISLMQIQVLFWLVQLYLMVKGGKHLSDSLSLLCDWDG